MPITITTPVVTPEIPAIPSKTFDKLWIRRMVVDGPSPNEPVVVSVSFKVYRIDESGNPEYYRNDQGVEPEIHLTIPNVFTLHDDDPADDTVVGQVLDAIQSIRDSINTAVGYSANGLVLVEVLTQALGNIAKENGLI